MTDAECECDSALRQRLDALLTAHDKPNELLPEGAAAAVSTIKLDLGEDDILLCSPVLQ
jgi:hypothetical protein